MSYTLVYNRPEEHAPYSAVKSVTMEIDDERNLAEMLDAYKEFLNGTGYRIDGDIVIDEPYTPEEVFE